MVLTVEFELEPVVLVVLSVEFEFVLAFVVILEDPEELAVEFGAVAFAESLPIFGGIL